MPKKRPNLNPGSRNGLKASSSQSISKYFNKLPDLESPYKTSLSNIHEISLSDENEFSSKSQSKIPKIFNQAIKKKGEKEKHKVTNKKLKNVFRKCDVNPEHLQLSIALSASESGADLGDACKDSCTRGKSIRSTLENYQFTTRSSKSTDRLRIPNVSENTKKRKKSRYAFITPTLYLRTTEDRLSLIHAKIASILSSSLPAKIAFVEKLPENELYSTSLKSFYSKNNIINKADYFYVNALKMESSTQYNCGCLLQNWRKIAGRPATPPLKGEEYLISSRCSPDLFESYLEESDTQQCLGLEENIKESNQIQNTSQSRLLNTTLSLNITEKPSFIAEKDEIVEECCKVNTYGSSSSKNGYTQIMTENDVSHKTSSPVPKNLVSNNYTTNACEYVIQSEEELENKEESSYNEETNYLDDDLKFLENDNFNSQTEISNDELYDSSLKSTSINKIKFENAKSIVQNTDVTSYSSDDLLEIQTNCISTKPEENNFNTLESENMLSQQSNVDSILISDDESSDLCQFLTSLRKQNSLLVKIEDHKYEPSERTAQDSILIYGEENYLYSPHTELEVNAVMDHKNTPSNSRCSLDNEFSYNNEPLIEMSISKCISKDIRQSLSLSELCQKYQNNDQIEIQSGKSSPMLNYDEMCTESLNKELNKYGVKSLKRERGIRILKYLYDSTHPVIEQSVEKIEANS